jgi:hypothetical protein
MTHLELIEEFKRGARAANRSRNNGDSLLDTVKRRIYYYNDRRHWNAQQKSSGKRKKHNGHQSFYYLRIALVHIDQGDNQDVRLVIRNCILAGYPTFRFE